MNGMFHGVKGDLDGWNFIRGRGVNLKSGRQEGSEIVLGVPSLAKGESKNKKAMHFKNLS